MLKHLCFHCLDTGDGIHTFIQIVGSIIPRKNILGILFSNRDLFHLFTLKMVFKKKLIPHLLQDDNLLN